MEVLPHQKFYIFVSNFSSKEGPLPKHMKVPHATNSPHFVHPVEIVTSKIHLIGRLKDNETLKPSPLMNATSDASAVH